MVNFTIYTETLFKAEEFLKATNNNYLLVGQRPYLDNNGKAGSKGVTLTLQIITDNADYGVDK